MQVASDARGELGPDWVLSSAPFGLTPIFWRVTSGRLATSAIAADLAEGACRLDLDRLSALLLGVAAPRQDASYFENVSRVPSDCVARVSHDGHVRLTFAHHEIEPLAIPPLEAAREMWKRIVASVGRCVEGRRKIAVLTGGGVDSSALLSAAIAASSGANEKEVAAVALHFGGYGDDRPHLQALVDDLGILPVRVYPSAAGRRMRGLLDNPRMPMWGAGAAGDQELLARAAECGADVALTGAGGDDLFDGYPRLLAEEVRSGHLGAIVRAAMLQVPWRSSAARRLSEFIARPLVAPAIPAILSRDRRKKYHAECAPWAGPVLRDFASREAENWAPADVRSPSKRYAYLARAAHISNAIELCDELARAANIRIAHPYLDEGLLRLASALEPMALLHGGRLRGLFRLAIRGEIPNSVRLRCDKASFALARQEMLRVAGGSAAFADLASMVECEKAGLVDGSKFRRAFAAFPEDLLTDDSIWSSIWPPLAVEGFLRARATLGRSW